MGRTSRAERRGVVITIAVAALVISMSWGVRGWVERELTTGVPVRVLGEVFRLTRGENTGIAFNLLRDSPLVPWLPVVALVIVAVYLVSTLRGQAVGAVASGLILGGGLANVLDRIGDGRVTDYLDWGLGTWRYATFNLPDSAVVVGLALAVWVSLHPSPRPGQGFGQVPAGASGERSL